MSTDIDFSPGLEVEIGRIDKELGRLWEDIGDKTRASLINLAIYTESAAGVAKDTDLIARIATEHACRAILIYANLSAESRGARAWINAHCHAVNKREICSEQITFQLDGAAAAGPSSLANVVFAHLDSDLPLCLWWQSPFREPLDSRLWSWVDRLIFDSNTWDDPAEQFGLVRRIAALGDVRTVLCDLNWTRLLNLRQGLAHFFDNACAAPSLRAIDHVAITHAPGARLSALLLLGWLANQLEWQLDSVLSRHAFRAPDRREISFSLEEKSGASVSACELRADGAQFRLERAERGEFYHATRSGERCGESAQLLPACRDRLHETLLMELSRGGNHPLYLKALDRILPLVA